MALRSFDSLPLELQVMISRKACACRREWNGWGAVLSQIQHAREKAWAISLGSVLIDSVMVTVMCCGMEFPAYHQPSTGSIRTTVVVVPRTRSRVICTGDARTTASIMVNHIDGTSFPRMILRHHHVYGRAAAKYLGA
jgi:hypothetical protein